MSREKLDRLIEQIWLTECRLPDYLGICFLQAIRSLEFHHLPILPISTAKQNNPATLHG